MKIISISIKTSEVLKTSDVLMQYLIMKLTDVLIEYSCVELVYFKFSIQRLSAG
jgi:hypothetical protein